MVRSVLIDSIYGWIRLMDIRSVLIDTARISMGLIDRIVQVFYFWDDSPDGRLHYEMDEYYLPVAMLGWISGMRMYYPTLYAPHMEPTLKLCLLSTKLARANNTNNKKHVELNLIANVCLRSEDGQSLLMNTSLPIGVGRVRRLRQITEAIMFDFLIDGTNR